MEMQKNIFSEEAGNERRHIWASIDTQGDLCLQGQDLGPTVEAIWGDSDYEYWLTIKSGDKDKVLLLLMEKVYGGHNDAVQEFREDLTSHAIEHQFMNWT